MDEATRHSFFFFRLWMMDNKQTVVFTEFWVGNHVVFLVASERQA